MFVVLLFSSVNPSSNQFSLDKFFGLIEMLIFDVKPTSDLLKVPVGHLFFPLFSIDSKLSFALKLDIAALFSLGFHSFFIRRRKLFAFRFTHGFMKLAFVFWVDADLCDFF